MWFVYALSAAVIWGISYAASGRAIERGVSPIVFFTLYAVVGALMGFGALAASGRLATFPDEIRGIGKDWVWLVIAVITSGVGALLIYMAIGEKNATVASLIEISYPLFVAFFAWLFFRETQFNAATVLGAVLIISGVGVVFLGNRH
ncbi:MAG TPA: EamA family transporter [Chthoniobacterales bacterium]|jgi:drug/metabolite transporter (DMT)-like permease